MVGIQSEYERLALEDREGQWELHNGEMRRKPGMTTRHNGVSWLLGFRIQVQLDLKEFEVRVNQARLRCVEGTSYIPDVVVVPVSVVHAAKLARPTRVEEYDVPLPLVMEVWSPSTGDYDVTDKLGEYQRRGDTEIWLVHPLEHWIKAWRRQPGGRYTETRYDAGVVAPASLPNVQIDLAELFAD